MKIVIGGDHFGVPLKRMLLPFIESLGYPVVDLGGYREDEPIDFPDIGRRVCLEIIEGRAQRGIMCCGTGVGASIAANKIPGIRATLCHDTYCAHQSVEHDNVNVITMGAWIVGPKTAQEVVATYLTAQFDASEDFVRRVGKLGDLERWAAQRVLGGLHTNLHCQ